MFTRPARALGFGDTPTPAATPAPSAPLSSRGFPCPSAPATAAPKAARLDALRNSLLLCSHIVSTPLRFPIQSITFVHHRRFHGLGQHRRPAHFHISACLARHHRA